MLASRLFGRRTMGQVSGCPDYQRRFCHGAQRTAWPSLGAALVLFVVGLVLTLTRVVTRSITPGLLIHVGYNLTLFHFALRRAPITFAILSE